MGDLLGPRKKKQPVETPTRKRTRGLLTMLIIIRVSNNIVAIDKSKGVIIWEVEADEKLDYKNPYEDVVNGGAFLIFFKSTGLKVAVNRHNGKILRSIDLNTDQ